MKALLLLLSLGAAHGQTLTVGPVAAQYRTLQAAVTAAPDTGAEITLAPGTYREVVHIDKPNIHLRGLAQDPAGVLIVSDMGDPVTCGTFCSPTVFVTGDGFTADNLSIQNDLSKRGKPRTQGVALSITADRAILRNVRLLGAQDTLFASSRPCKAATGQPCRISRQFYDHCYIEGEVDFIFGNAKAVFEQCEIRSVTHAPGGYLTAQSRNSPEEDSGYVFDHCRVTAEPGVDKVYLGRPWRDYATVTFLNTQLAADILPEGWSEWGKPGSKNPTDRLKTATYNEYNSTGPGANPAAREPLSHQLTAAQARQYDPGTYLAGQDHWNYFRP